MLYYLFEYLEKLDIPGAGMFQYITFRAASAIITSLLISLFLGKKIRIPKRRVDALLQREIGTHVVTYVNGRAQLFQQLYAGLRV